MAKKKKTKKKLSAYNRHVQREMKAGRSMKQAAASWKSGRKTSTRTAKRSTSRKTASKKKVRKVGKGGFNSQKIMKYVRLAALGAPAAMAAVGAGTPEQKLKVGVKFYTGVDLNDGSFNWQALAQGWTPYLASILVTHGIPKVAGIIRGL